MIKTVIITEQDWGLTMATVHARINEHDQFWNKTEHNPTVLNKWISRRIRQVLVDTINRYVNQRAHALKEAYRKHPQSFSIAKEQAIRTLKLRFENGSQCPLPQVLDRIYMSQDDLRLLLPSQRSTHASWRTTIESLITYSCQLRDHMRSGQPISTQNN